MPRGRRATAFDDAHAILQQLINEGRVSAADVTRCREIQQLEQRLAALRGGTGGMRRRGRPPATAARRPSAALSALSPQQRASRQLQGRYLALVRQIPASKRARFGQMVKQKGREAAIVPGDDVGGREQEAVGRDHDCATAAVQPPAPAGPVGNPEVRDRRSEPLRHADHRVGIGVERLLLGRNERQLGHASKLATGL